MSTVKLRRSNVPGKIPTDSQLDFGEVAINTHDGKMFFKQDANGNVEIVEVGRSDAVDNVLYVAESGDDNKSGETLGEAFATIDQALSVATSGTTIFVKSGSHVVDNTSGGLDIPAFCSIVGDSLRTTTIRGADANNDIFHVRSGSYITGVTFRDHTNGAAAISFNPDGSAGNIVTSPYIQNCSSFGPGGVGIRIDGSVVTGGLRSMVSDSFTQINSGGIGVHLLNRGYAQLVSIFTVACDVGILTESGGQCSLTNSNCSFGNFGLKSTGVSEVLYTGVLNGNASEGSETITVDNLSERPKYGDVIKFATEDYYYTVIDSTELISGESTVTLEEPLRQDFSDNVTLEFRQRSLITASSITFEFVGTGTSLYSTPRSGAFPIQENEVVEDETDNAGLVYYTSTDHKGDFRIGGELLINRQEGTITGTTFDRSLFAVLTPYILALED